jgi:hypothetical protein
LTAPSRRLRTSDASAKSSANRAIRSLPNTVCDRVIVRSRIARPMAIDTMLTRRVRT